MGNSDWEKHGVDRQGTALLKVSYHGIPQVKELIVTEQVEKIETGYHWVEWQT